MHSIWDVFDAVATAVPEREALVWREQRLSYDALRQRCLTTASVFRASGLGRRAPRANLNGWECGQSTIGCLLLNGPEYVEVMLGAFAASAVSFNINYRYTATEIAYVLNDARADAIVFHARFADTLADALTRVDSPPSLLLQVADESGAPLLPGAVDYADALSRSEPLAAADSQPDDLSILYTGGTTGMPKGALWRQADLWSAAIGPEYGDADLAGIAANTANVASRVLPSAPLMHGAGQWATLKALTSGGTVIINPIVDHLDPTDVWQTVEREAINIMLMAGEAIVRPLTEELEKGGYDASSVAAVVVGAAVTTPAAKARLLSLLPHAVIVDTAGSSETGTALRAVSAAGQTSEAGIFDRDANVSVLNASKTAQAQPGDLEEGWFAKGGPIPLGYLNDKAKTQATFITVDGERWSVPGDRARLLADGRVQLLGRDSITINSGGEKIFAEEVEGALLSHPSVRDVLVVPRASRRWGQEVAAVVSLYDEASDDELRTAAGQTIARYKLPRTVVRVAEIKRSPAGKADYAWARGLVERLPYPSDSEVS